MLKHTMIALAAAALLAGAPALALAQQSPPPAPQSFRAYGQQLMTPEERDALRKQMQEAKTPEERAKIRDEHRALMQKRAAEQGIELRGGAGEPRLYGSQLMTPAERQAYIDKMRSAKTPEERLKLRDEHRAEMQKRAKEKGITLSEPRGPGAGRGAKGAYGGRGQMYGQDLFTNEERAAFWKKMEAAKTPEERTKIRDEQRAIAQARAKEKGITLPEPGGRRGPGPGAGPGAPKPQ